MEERVCLLPELSQLPADGFPRRGALDASGVDQFKSCLKSWQVDRLPHPIDVVFLSLDIEDPRFLSILEREGTDQFERRWRRCRRLINCRLLHRHRLRSCCELNRFRNGCPICKPIGRSEKSVLCFDRFGKRYLPFGIPAGHA